MATETVKHTDGPWEFGSAGFEGDPPYLNIYHEGQAPIIASVLAEEVTEETATANARLIAAAPDLLAAAESFVRYYDEHLYQNGAFGDEIESLRKAVKQARGES